RDVDHALRPGRAHADDVHGAHPGTDHWCPRARDGGPHALALVLLRPRARPRDAVAARGPRRAPAAPGPGRRRGRGHSGRCAGAPRRRGPGVVARACAGRRRRGRAPPAGGDRRGDPSPRTRARAADVRRPRRQGERARPEPALRRPATPGDRPRARDRAATPTARRAVSRHEPARGPDAHRADRAPATGARAVGAPDRAPHGGRHGDLRPDHRARLRDAHRRGHPGGDPARLTGDRGVPRHRLRAGPRGLGMLDLADVSTYYGNIRALRGISLTVAPGEIVTLIGTNGAGKTTTLRTILGTVRPHRGT